MGEQDQKLEGGFDTTFILGDEEEQDVPGGFNDPLTGEPPPQETQTKEDNPDEAAADESEKAEAAGDQGDQEPGAQTEETPETIDYAQLLKESEEKRRAEISALTGQIQTLSSTVAQLQQKPEPETKEEEDPVFEMPTDEELANDPRGALARVMEQRDAAWQKRLDKALTDKIGEAERTRTEQANIQSQQQKAWQTSVALCPELDQEGSEVRNTMAQVYHQGGLKDVPMGPFYASAVAMVIHGKVPQQGEAAATDKAREEGAALERTRQDRVKKGAMHGGGKGGGQNKVQLSPEHRAAARNIGVSEKAYAEALQEMGVS